MNSFISLFLKTLFLLILLTNTVFAKELETNSFLDDLKIRIQEAYNTDSDSVIVEWKDDKLEKKIAEIEKSIKTKNIDLKVKDSFIKDISGKTGIPIEIYANNKLNRIIYVKCKVDVLKQALVAKNLIKKGDIISEEQLKYIKVPTSKINRLVVNDIAVASGKIATIDIKEDTVITSNLLKEKIVVFKGNQVTIRIRNGDLTLTGIGEALQDGSIGQNINIKVISFTAKKIIPAKVIDSSLVEVNLGGN